MDPGAQPELLEDPDELDRRRAGRIAIAVPGLLAGAPVHLPRPEHARVEAERLLLRREVEPEQPGREQDRRAGAELDQPRRGDQQPAVVAARTRAGRARRPRRPPGRGSGTTQPQRDPLVLRPQRPSRPRSPRSPARPRRPRRRRCRRRSHAARVSSTAAATRSCTGGGALTSSSGASGTSSTARSATAKSTSTPLRAAFSCATSIATGTRSTPDDRRVAELAPPRSPASRRRSRGPPPRRPARARACSATHIWVVGCEPEPNALPRRSMTTSIGRVGFAIERRADAHRRRSRRPRSSGAASSRPAPRRPRRRSPRAPRRRTARPSRRRTVAVLVAHAAGQQRQDDVEQVLVAGEGQAVHQPP